MLKTSFLAVSSLLLSTFVFAEKSYQDYWTDTQIKFESLIYGDINDLTCNKNVKVYVACFQAMNNALDILSNEKKVHLLKPSEGSNLEYPGFSVTSFDYDEKTHEDLMNKYQRELIHSYSSPQALSVFTQTPFTQLSRLLNLKIKGTGKEAYFTSLVFNTFLTYRFDPHTYISPRSYMEQRSSAVNVKKVYGLSYGVKQFRGRPKLVINSTQVGSPAYLAGIEKGDIIENINGVTDLNLFADEMKKNSMVIEINGSQGSRVLKLIRAEVSYLNVESEILVKEEKRYGYIKLTSFMDATSCDQITQIGIDFMKDNLAGVILDLRDNGGGRVDMATCIMGLFLESGATVWVEKDLATNKVSGSKLGYDQRVFFDIPSVVLINGRSASASEALSMYLQAYRKSYILGEKSFGKGTMQATGPARGMPEVTFARTVAKYYGPHGISPQLQGVIPDFEFYPEMGQTKATPVQREADLYKNAILNTPKEAPMMADRVLEIRAIKECMSSKSLVKKEFDSQDDFKKIVFDKQISGAKAVIDCTRSLEIPVFEGLEIARGKIE